MVQSLWHCRASFHQFIKWKYNYDIKETSQKTNAFLILKPEHICTSKLQIIAQMQHGITIILHRYVKYNIT